VLPSLHYWRIQRGLTQERLAELVAMRRTTMWRIEAGRPCLMRTAHLLAKALGVRVADLMSPPPQG
jgi:DNA-binding XRE family transcriptional regulator